MQLRPSATYHASVQVSSPTIIVTDRTSNCSKNLLGSRGGEKDAHLHSNRTTNAQLYSNKPISCN